MKSLNQSVIVSWNSDMIDIEIVGSQAATYTLDIVIDNHTLSFSCEKHCQVCFLIEYLCVRKFIIIYSYKPLDWNGGRKKVC